MPHSRKSTPPTRRAFADFPEVQLWFTPCSRSVSMTTLPAKSGAEPAFATSARATPRSPTTGKRRRPTVLIVDDNEDTREMYTWCMRAAGWVVEAVPSGEDAVFVAAVLAPDVIVMDLHLPVMGGLEAARRLKADPDTRHIPVVANSGIDRRDGEVLAMEAGCEAFVAKPCEPEQLRALLESLVR